jgi:hypothetical protein
MRIEQVYTKKTNQDAWLTEDPIYRAFRSIGRKIVSEQEAALEGKRLTQQDIMDIFQAVEQRMQSTGQNRTMIGRGKDATVAVTDALQRAFNGVAEKIQQSGPVSGFDVAVDKLTDRIGNAVGRDSKVMQGIERYREFGRRNPKMQMGVNAILVALAGLAGATGLASGGLVPAAVAGGIAAANSLLLGQRASSALWRGFTTGAGAYGASQLGAGVRGQDAAAVAQPGTQSATPAAPGAAAQTAAPTGPAAVDTGEVPGVTTFSGDVPRNMPQAPTAPAAPTAGGAGQAYTGGLRATTDMAPGGNISSNVQAPDTSAALQGPRDFVYNDQGELIPADSAEAQAMRDAQRLQAQRRYPVESKQSRKRRSLNEYQVHRIFRRVSRYQHMHNVLVESLLFKQHMLMERGDPQQYAGQLTGQNTAAPAAAPAQPAKPGFFSRMGQGLRTAGQQFTRVVTPEKLKMNWNAAGKPTDSAAVASILTQTGVDPQIVLDVYRDMKLPAPTHGRFAGLASTSEPAADQTVTSEPAADAAPTKMSAADFAGALKDLFDRYEQSDGNTGAPAVKSAIRDIWMRTGGEAIKETYTDDDYEQAMKDFLARGGSIEQGTYKEPRLKTRIRRQGSRHIGKGREPQASRQAGRGANVGSRGKPVVAVEGLTWSQDFDPGAQLWQRFQQTQP